MSLFIRSLVNNRLLVHSKLYFTHSKYVSQLEYSRFVRYSPKKLNTAHWRKSLSVRHGPKLNCLSRKLNLHKFTHENIYTIPNVLSFGRLLISPYLGYQIIQEQYQIATLLLCVASVTDLLDGMIARKWKNQASKFGSFLDPLADKVLVGTLFVSLTANHLIPYLALCSDPSLAANFLQFAASTMPQLPYPNIAHPPLVPPNIYPQHNYLNGFDPWPAYLPRTSSYNSTLPISLNRPVNPSTTYNTSTNQHVNFSMSSNSSECCSEPTSLSPDLSKNQDNSNNLKPKLFQPYKTDKI